MNTKKLTYLVPIDFTKETNNALLFAKDLAHGKEHQITLVHIVSNETERNMAEIKLRALAEEHHTDGTAVKALVFVGSILADIGKVAQSVEASLIIMGTHHSSVFQKIMGSNAMKVVSNSEVPLILLQGETHFHAIKTIVMSLDLEKESIQVVKAAAATAKLFGATVQLVAPEQNDEFFKRRIELNLRVAQNYLRENGLTTEIHFLNHSGFAKALISYCEEKQANLLAATYYQEGFALFTENLVEALAHNSLNLPVMTINGENTSSATQFGFLTV